MGNYAVKCRDKVVSLLKTADLSRYNLSHEKNFSVGRCLIPQSNDTMTRHHSSLLRDKEL
jgi:hypothetical protein